MNIPDTAPGPETGLSPLLQTWRVGVPLDAGFKARVWRRIANDGAPAGWRLGAALRAWLDQMFARPLWSIGYALLLMSAGLIAGYWQATEQSARWDQAMATRYVQSVDPSFHLTAEP